MDLDDHRSRRHGAARRTAICHSRASSAPTLGVFQVLVVVVVGDIVVGIVVLDVPAILVIIAVFVAPVVLVVLVALAVFDVNYVRLVLVVLLIRVVLLAIVVLVFRVDLAVLVVLGVLDLFAVPVVALVVIVVLGVLAVIVVAVGSVVVVVLASSWADSLISVFIKFELPFMSSFFLLFSKPLRYSCISAPIYATPNMWYIRALQTVFRQGQLRHHPR